LRAERAAADEADTRDAMLGVLDRRRRDAAVDDRADRGGEFGAGIAAGVIAALVVVVTHW
jgi:hypothetical protein